MYVVSSNGDDVYTGHALNEISIYKCVTTCVLYVQSQTKKSFTDAHMYCFMCAFVADSVRMCGLTGLRVSY